MKLIKEIKSKAGDVHFKRWEILKTRWGSIWLHAIYKADTDKHLHNHPWDFTSIVLKGSYIEQTQKGINFQRPGKINVRDGSEYHKILQMETPVVYTLFFASKPKRLWGYDVDGRFIDHETYREMKNKGELKN
jgi:hypothetical protein